jgi:hypothetical protein
LATIVAFLASAAEPDEKVTSALRSPVPVHFAEDAVYRAVYGVQVTQAARAARGPTPSPA